jgi:hypothetical protein
LVSCGSGAGFQKSIFVFLLHIEGCLHSHWSHEGYLNVRDEDDRWARVSLSKRGLIDIPAGIYSHHESVVTLDWCSTRHPKPRIHAAVFPCSSWPSYHEIFMKFKTKIRDMLLWKEMMSCKIDTSINSEPKRWSVDIAFKNRWYFMSHLLNLILHT